MVLLSVLSWGSGKAAVQSDAAAKPASGQVAVGPEARDTGNVGLPMAEARALLDHQKLDQLLVAARGGASAKLEDVRVALLLAIKEIDSRGKPGEPDEAAKYLQRIKASLIAQAYGNEAYRYDPLAAAPSREAIRRGLIALQSSADDALLVYARMWVGLFDKDAATVARCQELLKQTDPFLSKQAAQKLPDARLTIALSKSIDAGFQPVRASLVAADSSIQPGRPFVVALRLVHQLHWNTFWLNPGTGTATTLTWTLPAGFTAGAIQWPAPFLVNEGDSFVHGYQGDLLLPVTITPPADLKPGTTVDLVALAEWQADSGICQLGQADLLLSLPVTAEAAHPDPVWGEKIGAVLGGLPREDPLWRLAARRESDRIKLTVTPTRELNAVPRDVHFFSEDGLVDYEARQTRSSNGNEFTVELTASAEGAKDSTRLLGVLTSEFGWLPDGSLRGLRVDVPIAPGEPRAPAEAR
jgi:DsbC/DsbD-like thiol-disulfide interchange protein